jgi:putative transcriptional regulator
LKRSTVRAGGNYMARPLFDALRGSLEEAIAFHRGKATLRTHTWHMEPAPKFAARDIRRLRSKLRVSQGVLAAALNVSLAAVQSWEQGRRRPEGAARRLLEILARHPQSLLRPTSRRSAA